MPRPPHLASGRDGPPGSTAQRAAVAIAVATTTALLATPASRVEGGGAFWLLALLVLAPPLIAQVARRPGLQRTPWTGPERLALLLAALPLLGGAIQLVALARLDATAPVAASGMSAAAAGEAVLHGMLLHAVLPASLLTFLPLFAIATGSSERWLARLPLALAPTALVAIYQSRIDMERWNVAHFVRHGRASGLAYDANSLAACLYLVLPLAVLAALRRGPRSRRLVAGAAALLLGAALPATGNRAALAAVALGVVLAPWAALRLGGPTDRRARRALALAPLLLAATLYGLLDAAAGRTIPGASGVARLADTLDEMRDEGLAETLRESGRQELWLRALRIWRQAPIAGVGPGGFARELADDRFRADLPGLVAVPDLAASHYLQVAVELGAIGLALHLALLLIPVGWFARRRGLASSASAASGVVATTLVVAIPLLQFNHYLLFPDVAWLLGLLLAAAAATASQDASPPRRAAAVAGLLLLALFALASAFAAFGPRGFHGRADADWWPFRNDAGCYPVESWEGIATRWCAPDARLAIPIDWPGDRAVALSVLAMHPDLDRRPLSVGLQSAGGWRSDLVFDRSRWLQVTVPVAAAAVRPCVSADGRRRSCLAIRLHAARGWRPSDWGESADDRWLGVAVQARPLPDLTRLPGHLFDDGFERGDLGRWRVGEDEDPGLPSAAEAAEPRGGG